VEKGVILPYFLHPDIVEKKQSKNGQIICISGKSMYICRRNNKKDGKTDDKYLLVVALAM
jgi:hypothetical protein